MKKLLFLVVLGILFSLNAYAASITEELTKLNDLYKDVAITKEEFSKAKSILLKTEVKEVLKDSQNQIEEKKENNISTSLTLIEEDILKKQISKCWSIPLGLPYNENLLVRIKLKLKPDGTILETEILDHERLNMPGQGFYKVLAESTIRAIRSCQPLKVPNDNYEMWREMIINFDPKEMLYN